MFHKVLLPWSQYIINIIAYKIIYIYTLIVCVCKEIPVPIPASNMVYRCVQRYIDIYLYIFIFIFKYILYICIYIYSASPFAYKNTSTLESTESA